MFQLCLVLLLMHVAATHSPDPFITYLMRTQRRTNRKVVAVRIKTRKNYFLIIYSTNQLVCAIVGKILIKANYPIAGLEQLR